MEEKIITPALLAAFEDYLTADEKSKATRNKYRHDIGCFTDFVAHRPLDKPLVLEYKAALERRYAPSSVNSMLAALNAFLRFAGWPDLCVKQLRVQKKVYCPEEKELTRAEYERLIAAAEAKDNERLSLVIQTICGTGIRVSELRYITVEAAKKGEAIVHCKGKTRLVFMIAALRQKLLEYAKEHNITTGMIFTTKSGKPLDRSNIWKDMKDLCKQADVSPEKVFPHNLRHLFARTFYGLEKDIAKLADILGHSSINTTRIYVMTTGAEHRQKMESLRLVE